MRYSGTYTIQVGFNEHTFCDNGRTLEEIALTLDSPLKGSKDVIQQNLAMVFLPFSARIRVPKRKEIYIRVWIQGVVPSRDFEATAERNDIDRIVRFPPPCLQEEVHFEIHRKATQNSDNSVLHMPFYSAIEITSNTHDHESDVTLQCGVQVKFIQEGRMRIEVSVKC